MSIMPVLNRFHRVGLPSSNNLNRFLWAQKGTLGYSIALKEIKNGKKDSHWIWYIFPQLRGLGFSSFSNYYGLSDLDEAKAYLKHKVLGKRLREISRAFLEHQDMPAEEILSSLDAIKVHSCMTLFDLVSPNDVFAEVLEAFYCGSRDEQTISLLDLSKRLTLLELDEHCTKEEVEANYCRLVYMLNDYGINVTFINVAVGPLDIIYMVKPTSKEHIERIGKLESDIALALTVVRASVIAPMHNGDDVVGITIPRAKPRSVS